MSTCDGHPQNYVHSSLLRLGFNDTAYDDAFTVLPTVYGQQWWQAGRRRCWDEAAVLSRLLVRSGGGRALLAHFINAQTSLDAANIMRQGGIVMLRSGCSRVSSTLAGVVDVTSDDEHATSQHPPPRMHVRWRPGPTPVLICRSLNPTPLHPQLRLDGCAGCDHSQLRMPLLRWWLATSILI